MKRSLPHSLDAERAVLGGLMLDADDADAVTALLGAKDFYRETHGALFDLLVEMREAGEPLEMLAVVEKIDAAGRGAEMGGLSYVSSLPDNAPSTENVRYYAEQIAELAERRRLLLGLEDAGDTLRRGQTTAEAAAGALLELAEPRRASAVDATAHVGVVVASVADEIDAEADGEREIYFASGIGDLDEQSGFHGVSREGVTLVIGQSGMGKTSVLNRLALGLSHNGHQVLLYGTETSKRRRTKDLIFALAGVDMSRWAERCNARARLRKATAAGAHSLRVVLPFEDWIRASQARLRWAQGELSRLPLEVCDSGWTIDRLCAHVRRRRRQGRVDAVIADYLQDFVFSKSVEQKTAAQVAYTSKTFKNLCAQTGLPGIIGAQRSDEKGQSIRGHKPGRGEALAPAGHRYLIPQMQDVQWASAAFQDAEEVLCLYRPRYFAERYPEVHETNPFNWDCDFDDLKIVCRKRRVGGMAEWHVPFDAPCKWVGARPPAWRFAA